MFPLFLGWWLSGGGCGALIRKRWAAFIASRTSVNFFRVQNMSQVPTFYSATPLIKNREVPILQSPCI